MFPFIFLLQSWSRLRMLFLPFPSLPFPYRSLPYLNTTDIPRKRRQGLVDRDLHLAVRGRGGGRGRKQAGSSNQTFRLQLVSCGMALSSILLQKHGSTVYAADEHPFDVKHPLSLPLAACPWQAVSQRRVGVVIGFECDRSCGMKQGRNKDRTKREAGLDSRFFFVIYFSLEASRHRGITSTSTSGKTCRAPLVHKGPKGFN